MRMRTLGRSGLTVSEVGLGCNNFGSRTDQDQTNAVVNTALDAGVNFFDTADVYSKGESEVMLGVALRTRRREAVVTTKFGTVPEPTRGGSRHWVMTAVEASLKRLGTDYIDLLQMHRPDPLTPIEETLRALDDLVRQGKVLYIGHSRFAAWQLAEAELVARSLGVERFISCQLEYSLLERGVEAEALPACERFGVGFLPFLPLSAGALTGKFRRGEPAPADTRMSEKPFYALPLDEDLFDRVEPLEAYAKSRGHSLLELAFAWLLANPLVSSVIAGARTPEQVTANVAAGQWRLTPEEYKEVTALLR